MVILVVHQFPLNNCTTRKRYFQNLYRSRRSIAPAQNICMLGEPRLCLNKCVLSLLKELQVQAFSDGFAIKVCGHSFSIGCLYFRGIWQDSLSKTDTKNKYTRYNEIGLCIQNIDPILHSDHSDFWA